MNSVAVYRALAIKSGLSFYVKTGQRINRAYTPSAMMRAAADITGRRFKARDYASAILALNEWMGEAVMTEDLSEQFRRDELAAQALDGPLERSQLAERYGQLWDIQQLQDDFQVISFIAPFVLVRRRSDNQRGTLRFQHTPRFYYDYMPE